MENLKEKILCALESNAEKLYRWVDESYNLKCGLSMYSEPITVPYKPTNIFNKFFLGGSWVDTGKSSYCASFQGEEVELTKEEFDNILKIRQEKIEQKRIEELDKLCKK